jgi:hypothetical protein
VADESAQKVARDAALQSLVSNAVYLALMIGISVAITKRDALKRLRLRLEQIMRQDDAAKQSERKALAEFRRELSLIEHWLNRADRGPESPPETPGGLYGQG